jgi:hypothetical protein
MYQTNLGDDEGKLGTAFQTKETTLPGILTLYFKLWLQGRIMLEDIPAFCIPKHLQEKVSKGQIDISSAYLISPEDLQEISNHIFHFIKTDLTACFIIRDYLQSNDDPTFFAVEGYENEKMERWIDENGDRCGWSVEDLNEI